MLHCAIYAGLQHATAAEWFDYISAIPEVEYGWVEWQAYEFAGRLLVPPEPLREAFQAAIQSEHKVHVSRTSTEFCIRQPPAERLQNLLCNLTKHSNSCQYPIARRFRTSGIFSLAGC